MIPSYRRFRPALALEHQSQVLEIAREVSRAGFDGGRDVLQGAVQAADARISSLEHLGLRREDLGPAVAFAAALRVLRDLVVQGWTIREDDEGIILDAPGAGMCRTGDDPEEAKRMLRKSFSFAREAQLSERATRAFIASMERNGIRELFADGAELADRLVTEGTHGVQPQLELIEPGARDSTTGLSLQDIWRYARLFWSIPYQSTPGRNIFYLIRDTALATKPLIGIAALGNPVLGLSQRDFTYGWSAHGLVHRMESMTDQKKQAIANHLIDTLRQGIEETYSGDLDLPNDPFQQWHESVRRLETIEHDSAADRLKRLEQIGAGHPPEYDLMRYAYQAVQQGRSGEVDWRQLALTPLYRRKRAATLAGLLRALGYFRSVGLDRGQTTLDECLKSDEGVRAVETTLRRIKQGVIASSVMEIITCGALPPYRDVLGGKLVAMLMTSSEVVEAFSSRYAGRVSLIASALAGRAVSRPARLALLTTSSLYALGSSQYNRIKVTVGARAVEYRRVGITDSFGTIHLAPDTVRNLHTVAMTFSNRREVNNLFGEGTSPKLRQIRAGLEHLGLDPETFLRHHSPRLLFGAALCSNIDDVLLGLSQEPEYVLPENAEASHLLIENWRERWLERRVRRPDILSRLHQQKFENFRLGLEIEQLAVAAESEKLNRPRAQGVGGEQPGPVSLEASSFLERLYRSTKSYADRLSQEELDDIHVDLGVDAYLLEQVKAGRQIIVTGNPGDGKTHLIERMRARLESEGAKVITDANAVSNNEMLDAWRECASTGRPFVLAINEWPLYVLHRLAHPEGFGPVKEALRQVTTARFFVEAQRPSPPQGDVRVIDLSLRNLLAPSVVRKMLDKLSEGRFTSGFHPADPALKNREALRETLVQERLSSLLEVVATRFGHATVRQLVGFVAYLITGGRSAAERLRIGQGASSFMYSTLAFEGGVGPLFDAVRTIFDPALITHPEWDERLWLGDTAANDWLQGAPPGIMSLPESERADAFRIIKRRFFFEHRSGADLLEMLPRDEKTFRGVLSTEIEGGLSLVRDLVLSLNRFFEPNCSETERNALQLWQSHRYDVRPPTAFVALRDLPFQQLRVEGVKVASWVEDWLPQEQRHQRSFALVASHGEGDIAMLEVDRDLYLTLFEAQHGLGRSSWSRTATRRITRFIDRLQRAVETQLGVEDVRIRNAVSGLDERFAIQRSPSRYQI